MPTKSWQHTWNRTAFSTLVEPGQPDTTRADQFVIDRVNTVTSEIGSPRWKELIANGDNATTSLIGTRYTVKKWKPVSARADHLAVPGLSYTGSGYPSSGVLLHFPSPVFTPTNKAQSDAETNLSKSYRKATRQMQGGVFIGEIMETARLLRNPVKGMYGLTKDFTQVLRRMKKFEPRKYRAALSDAWLTYKFGMEPLASDANDYCTALRALASGRTFDIIRVRGTGRDAELDTSWADHPVGFVGADLGCFADTEVLRKYEVTIRGGVKVNITPNGELPVPMRFGLSVLDIVPTAWEIIPFSFLVDYFTNVGDTLDALMLRFVNFSWLNQTVRNSMEVTQTDWRVPFESGGYRRSVTGGSGHFCTKTISRETRGNDFGGGLTFSVPGLQSVRWLNIAALANSILLSRPNR